MTYVCSMPHVWLTQEACSSACQTHSPAEITIIIIMSVEIIMMIMVSTDIIMIIVISAGLCVWQAEEQSINQRWSQLRSSLIDNNVAQSAAVIRKSTNWHIRRVPLRELMPDALYLSDWTQFCLTHDPSNTIPCKRSSRQSTPSIFINLQIAAKQSTSLDNKMCVMLGNQCCYQMWASTVPLKRHVTNRVHH